MARRDINIGVEGNDGTGDSIRSSFNKVNENFVELYAVFGLGGRINFTSLNDTPDRLTPTAIPIVIAAIVIVIISSGMPKRPIIPNIKKAAIKFGTTPIKQSLMFLNKIMNIAKIPIITSPKVKI